MSIEIIEFLKSIIPTIVAVLVAYFGLKGRIDQLEFRLDNKKIRIDKLELRVDKLEDQRENNTKNFQELIHSIDTLNNNLVNLEKRLEEKIK